MPVQTEDRGTRRAFAVLGGVAVVAGLAIIALVIALGGDDGKNSSAARSRIATATSAAPSARIAVSLREFRIAPSSTVGRAGRVTFRVTNSGRITHEFVVLRTQHPANALPMKNGRASEAGNVGETGDLPSGSSKTLSLRLQPGHYVFVCNLPGHYLAGQRADFTVK